MKRRSFIQGALALIGVTVGVKFLPTETDPITKVYYMNQIKVGKVSTGPALVYITHPMPLPSFEEGQVIIFGDGGGSVGRVTNVETV